MMVSWTLNEVYRKTLHNKNSQLSQLHIVSRDIGSELSISNWDRNWKLQESACAKLNFNINKHEINLEVRVDMKLLHVSNK